MARFAGLTQTPHPNEDFSDSVNDGVFVEFILFNKRVDDVEKRHAVLFEKLGLGS